MIALAGYSGFVGSNIYARARNRIEGVFNTQNIEKAYGLEPDVLIFAGLRHDRQLAAKAPYKDYELVLEAQKNIRKINPNRLVLISTTEVYENPVGVDEENSVFAAGRGKSGKSGIQPYGLNRYYFEEWVRKNYPDSLIVRLAIPYGLNPRRNYIQDVVNLRIRQADPKSAYQFYPLSRLWEDIQTALMEKLTLVNLASEPISVGELSQCITGNKLPVVSNKPISKLDKSKTNLFSPGLQNRDVLSVHAQLFGGSEHYVCRKSEVLGNIKQYIDKDML